MYRLPNERHSGLRDGPNTLLISSVRPGRQVEEFGTCHSCAPIDRMKRYPLKYLFFVLPFAIAVVIEMVLPVDFFTFKVWESLLVRNNFGILYGPFYPNMELRKTEQGDLAHHTPYTTMKDVVWYTDRYGYRKKESGAKKYEIVIIGDSNTAGSGLTQNDMLSEVLERKLRVNVYPLAPGGARRYSQHRLFQEKPPDIVILASIERNILYFTEPKKTTFKPDDDLLTKIHNAIQEVPALQSAAVVLNRLDKNTMLQFLRATISRVGKPIARCIPVEGQCFFFYQGAKANGAVSPEAFQIGINTIKRFDDIFKGMGIRFIFLPIPNKETVYYRYLGTERPVFLDQLNRRLRELGIETIDTQQAFDEAFERDGLQLFYPDDTHWNRYGVRVTADLVAGHLENGRSFPETSGQVLQTY